MKTEEKNNGTMIKMSEHEPFAIAKIEDKYQIVIGKYVVSQMKFELLDDAEMYISSKPYELTINACLAILKMNEEYEKRNTDSNNNANKLHNNKGANEKK